MSTVRRLVSEQFVLDKVMTNSGFSCPISVQAAFHWTRTLQTLYSIGQGVDEDCILHLIRRTVDRVWTGIGQRLDFVSSVRPTNHWLGVLTGSSQKLLNHARQKKHYFRHFFTSFLHGDAIFILTMGHSLSLCVSLITQTDQTHSVITSKLALRFRDLTESCVIEKGACHHLHC